MTDALRPYQHADKEALRALYRAGKRRCVYQLATGGGKSLTACSMISDAIARGRATRVLVHRIELVEQFNSTLAGCGIDGVPVSMAQTLTRRLDRTAAPDLLVIDECVDGGAIVRTDVGPVRLQDIPTSGATSVVSFDGAGAVWRKITGWKDSGQRSCMCLHVDDGSSIVCTPNHMVFSGGEWRQAQEVRSGDLITVLAGVGAAASSPEASRDTLASSSSDTKHHLPPASALKSTGRTACNAISLQLLCAAVAAASASCRRLEQLMRWSNNELYHRNIQNIFMGTISGRLIGISRLLRQSSKLSLGRYLATDALDTRTARRHHHGYHGRTGQNSVIGLPTKRASWHGLPLASRNAKTLGMVRQAFALSRHACLASKAFLISFGHLEARLFPWGGLIQLGTSGLLGGFVTMGASPTTALSSIRKGTARARIPSSRIGSAGDTGTLQSRGPAAGISTCAQIQQRQEGSGTLCATTSQRVCSTKSARVLATSHCGQRQVFDISVEEDHCFFANGILVHNCHHATSETWARIIRAWPDAWVLGLTATPARTDGRGLGEIFDGLVCGPSMRQLMDDGYLARYRLYAPPAPDTSGLRKRAGDYTSESLSAVFDRPQIVGDVVAHYRRHGGGRQFVAFGVSVDHAHNLASGFQKAGVACEVLHGGMSGPDRKRIVQAVKCGALQGIANCDIVSEGFDVPAIGCVILAGRTLSLIRYLQRIGRGLRPDGDRDAVILDHGGNVFIHGMPDQPREWSLAGVAKKASRSEVVIRHCPECFAVFAGHLAACPYCGYAVERKIRTLRQQDGELVEVNYWADAPVSAAQTIDDLRAIAAARGYHRGWVFHAAREQLRMPEIEARKATGWWR